MIELLGVTVERDSRDVLKDIDLKLTERRVGIIGANGSGKSTLVRLFNGLLLPTRGDVQVDGLSTLKKGREVRRKVGFVFQNPDNQIVYPTVSEDLAFGLKSLGRSKAETAEMVDACLAAYGLSHLKFRLTHQLSEGEKQMVAIAGVTIMKPEYIVFDEPTTLLDLGNKYKIMQTIRTVEQSVVLVSHDLDLLADFDRLICIHDGLIHIDGTPDKVISAYKKLFA
jgi:biotin transport system ATP-binding protein